MNTNTLLEAAYDGDLQGVKTAIESGDDIHMDNDSAIHMAAIRGHLEVVKYLHQAGVILRINILRMAAFNGHIDVVRYIHNNGVNIQDIVKIMENGKVFGDNGWLAQIAGRGHIQTIKYLCENCDNIETHICSALRSAARGGHLDIVKYLCENGANIDSLDIYGRSAIHVASRCGHLHVVKYLLQLGADIVRVTEILPILSVDIQHEFESFNNKITRIKCANKRN